MATYSPLVERFLEIGDAFGKEVLDYVDEFELTCQHIPELIRLAADAEIYAREWDEDDPVLWAPVHARRALGQLKAVEAVQPLLDSMVQFGELDDTFLSDLPKIFAEIGPSAIPTLVAMLSDSGKDEFDRACCSNALARIGKEHPESRDECVALLSAELARNGDESRFLNALLVDDLVKLKAVESAGTIEAAFAAGVIDESVVGNWERVQFELGIGPAPPPPSERRFDDHDSVFRGWAMEGVRATGPAIAGPQSQRQKKQKLKAQKAARKRNRKRR